MFDYASYNSSIYTKRFLNYNSAAAEEKERERGKKEKKPIRSTWRGNSREIDWRILTSVERQDFSLLRPDSADWGAVKLSVACTGMHVHTHTHTSLSGTHIDRKRKRNHHQSYIRAPTYVWE